VESALNEALTAGYRHIDAAPVYMNEIVIGRVLKEWIDSGKLSRTDLFITTKLPPQGKCLLSLFSFFTPILCPIGNRASSVEKYLRSSLADLQLDYVDLYLIHTPFTLVDSDSELKREADGSMVLETTTDHIATWKVS
jgi:alcohol dehydrogenase (NADP+)